MRHQDFQTGVFFDYGGHTWKVTDIGSRVVVAIKWKDGWMCGPPYAVAEHVFDENDMEAISHTYVKG